MKRLAKMTAAMLACAMLLSGCNSGAKSTGSGGKSSASPVDIVYAYVLPGTVPTDQSMIQDELNKLTIAKANVKVTLLPIPGSSYKQKINLMISSGDKLDLMMSMNFVQQVTQKQLLPLDELLDQYGSGIKDALGSGFLKGTTVDGKIYGVTLGNGKASAPNAIMRKDILDKYGLSIDSVNSLDDLAKIYAVVHKNDPNMICLAPSSNQSLLLAPNTLLMDNSYDGLGDGYGALFGNGNYKVTDVYESSEYKNLLATMRDWYLKGYIMKDAATSTEAINEMIKSGNTFSTIQGEGPGADTQISTATGFQIVQKKLTEPLITTGTLNGLCWSVPITCNTSEKREAAMKFLNLTYTDPDIVNLLDFGIKGKHYVLQPDGAANFPSGVTATTSTYNPTIDWEIGNQLISYGWIKSYNKQLAADNKAAKQSTALGFSFDTSKVKTQYTAVGNVVAQYEPGLDCGAIDYKTALPQFISSLKAAGINDIIKEKQAQLDEWVSANKKK